MAESRIEVRVSEPQADIQGEIAEFISAAQTHLDSIRMATIKMLGQRSFRAVRRDRNGDCEPGGVTGEEHRQLRHQSIQMQQDKAESDTLGASLDELLATRTAEAQFLRSQAELERYKARLKAADLEKQVALKDSELERFRAALRESLAEHLRTKRDLLALERQYETKSDDFQMELQQLQSECTELRRALASSWALRIARSLGWLLGPVRKRMA